MLVSHEYIKLLARIANHRFLKGRDKLRMLEKDIREKL
jgi:tRNA(Phe) wybutosine-synthesizing methylase Tyw3